MTLDFVRSSFIARLMLPLFLAVVIERPAFAVETITFRSGNGAIGQTDSSYHFAAGNGPFTAAGRSVGGPASYEGAGPLHRREGPGQGAGDPPLGGEGHRRGVVGGRPEAC